jgi:hypothetical protein
MAGLFVPLDGRICSQNPLSGPLFGGEAMEIVSSGVAAAATNANGNTYQITLLTLAAWFSAFPSLNTEIVTAGSVYDILPTDTKILVNKTLSSATSVVFPLVNTMTYDQPVLVKDVKGDAATNPITITFTGGQLCDGLSSITINVAYGWVTINPVPGGNGWYMTS